MAANKYGLRALANQLIIGKGELPYVGLMIPVQSNLERYGMAMRNATRLVQYYSKYYDYEKVQKEMNNEAKKSFNKGNNNGLGA